MIRGSRLPNSIPGRATPQSRGGSRSVGMAGPIRGMFHWFSNRLRAGARCTVVYLDDYTLRDIGLTRMEYLFLNVSGSTDAQCGGRRPEKRSSVYAGARRNVPITDRA
jgi:hypothetical protein